MIKIKKFVFNPFQVNTYLLFDDADNEAYIIDAACSDKNEKSELLDFIEKRNLKIKALINTHCHVDHLLGVQELREIFNVDFYCSEPDQFLIDNSVAQGEFFGLRVNKPGPPDKYLVEGETLKLGESKIQVFQVPGHSPGSLIYYLENENIMFTGDVLFQGSIGRTDLPGGNYQKLVTGIQQKIMNLSDSIELFPGHGPSTTIGQEKLTNPFLQ